MFYFKDDNQCTVYFSNGDVTIFKSDNPQYNCIVQLCEKSDFEQIEILHNQAKAFLEGNVTISNNDRISVNDIVIENENKENTLINFILLLKDKGVINSEITRIKPFLKNMFMNPYIDSVQELYDYCTAMDFEITEDGCFLAYKNVNSDLTSRYDDKTAHVIGEYTEVTQFDTDRHRDCSQGLHFAAKKYLEHYSGPVTIIVKINPMDVVAIPKDYKCMKGRCKKYLTVGIMAKESSFDTVDIEKVTKEKVVKTEKTKQNKNPRISRVKETAQWLDIYTQQNPKGLYIHERIAETMGISVETVKRNIRKYRTGNY